MHNPLVPAATLTPTMDYKGDISLLPVFDNTKLVALNTCPTWGLLRYDQHKAMPGAGRSMALEAGAAAHECFAAARFFIALEHYSGADRELVLAHGVRVFGEDRWNRMLQCYDLGEDRRRRILGMVLECLSSSGFYEDPNDKRRTVANIEQSLIAYVDRIATGENIPAIINGVVGIEQPIDVVIGLKPDMGLPHLRFVGRMDALEWREDHTRLHLAENKTASRLDNSWVMSFETSHQITGYLAGISSMLKLPSFLSQATVYGMSIPLPKTYDYGGIAQVPVHRYDFQFSEWIVWMIHTVQLWARWRGDVANAPKYTHSCNRYFRPCSFIPFCASPPEERQEIIDQMVDDKWSPLEEGQGHE